MLTVGTLYCPDPRIKQALQGLKNAQSQGYQPGPGVVAATPIPGQVTPPATPPPAPAQPSGNVQAFLNTVTNKSITDMRTEITKYKANLDAMDSCLEAFQKVLTQPKDMIGKNRDFYQKFVASTPDQQKQTTMGSEFSDIDKQAYAKVQDLMTKIPAQNSKSFLDLIIKQLDASSK